MNKAQRDYIISSVEKIRKLMFAFGSGGLLFCLLTMRRGLRSPLFVFFACLFIVMVLCSIFVPDENILREYFNNKEEKNL